MAGEYSGMVWVGLDLGQRVDYSAVALVERWERTRPYQTPELHKLAVRWAERLRLGTPYPMVVERVRELTECRELRGRCGVVVDVTGVGAPVVDMLRRAGLGCEVMPVTITSGDRESQRPGPGGTEWSVPKQDLVTGMQVLLERGELEIARGIPDGMALRREMLDMRATPQLNGRVRLGADGRGEHDDLVIALALACWRAKKRGGPAPMGSPKRTVRTVEDYDPVLRFHCRL